MTEIDADLAELRSIVKRFDELIAKHEREMDVIRDRLNNFKFTGVRQEQNLLKWRERTAASIAGLKAMKYQVEIYIIEIEKIRNREPVAGPRKSP